MKRIILTLALAGLFLQAHSAILPPEKILPKDTVLVVCAPDWVKAWAFMTNTPYGRLWQDPALKPFKDKFIDHATTDLITPMEHNLGIKFSDYQGLAQGQVTYALLPAGPHDDPDHHFAQILLIDSRDHAAQLKSSLAAVIKKWADAGKPMKSRKIREQDFSTLVLTPEDLSWSKIFQTAKPAGAAAEADAKREAKNLEITIGQVDSLLVACNSPDAIERILSRQAGGLVPALEELPAFQGDFGSRLRNSPVYAWVNVKALREVLSKVPPGSDDDTGGGLAKFNTYFTATGLDNVTSASFSYQNSPDGVGAQLFIGAPEDKRAGLLKAFTAEAKDSSAPAFVPADAVKFWRWRLNIPHSWATIESMLNELNPQMVSVLNTVLQHAGKDKDEHYDLKSELLASLGDDVISYEKVPKATSLADLKSAPSIFLIGSPDPDRLTAALKVAFGVMAQASGGVKDREFLGRKIYFIPAPGSDSAASPVLSFAGSGGYVAISGDIGLLEEYLRSNDTKAKALMETAGLGEAAQKAGGLGTGWFGYENQNQNMRPVFDVLRKQSLTLSDLIGAPLPSIFSSLSPEQIAKFRDWLDFSLLPPFDSVSKYLYYSVYAGGFSADGFTLKIFAPTPPQLR
ncbi:MAG: hypothetical protein ABSG59_20935 [Verrucomicrobiota bacterium]|jgi:hypothetical protein